MFNLKVMIGRYKLVLFSFVFLFAAVLIEKNAVNWYQSEISTENIQTVLWKKEVQTSEIFDQIERLISEYGFDGFIKDHSDEISKISKLKDISFLVYENDSLKYWSDNSIVVSPVLNNSEFRSKFSRFTNSWYVVKKRETEIRVLVGLILVKRDYAFENAFLKNKFQRSFGRDLKAKITAERNEEFDVYSKDGTYLFSLEEIPAANPGLLYGLSTFLYFLSFVFLLGFIEKWFRWLAIKILLPRNIMVLGISGLIVLFRYLMLKYSFPGILENLTLFEPYHYAKSFWFPSLGDFFLNSFLLLFLAFLFFRNFDYSRILRIGISPVICLFFSSLFITIFYMFFHYLLRGLVLNSSILIEVYNIFSSNYYTLIGYFGLAFLLLSMILFIDKIISVYSGIFSFWKLAGLISAFTIAVFIPFIILDRVVTLSQPGFLLIIIFPILYFRSYQLRYSFPNKIFILLLMAVFTLFFLSGLSLEKEKNIRRVMAVNLANERDQVAEFLFEDLEVKLKTDTTLQGLIKDSDYYDHELFEYLDNTYFNRFFRKYDMQIACCGTDDDLLLEDLNELVDCYGFFNDMLEDHGVNIYPGSEFFYLDNQNGRISYLGALTFYFNEFPLERKLYISLDSKLMTEQLGYPELLLEGKFGRSSPFASYSYAKYFQNKLISRSGSYSYALEFNYLDEFEDDMVYVGANGFNHLIYRVDKDNIIILSKQEVKWIDIITSFSYLFVFYFLLFGLFVFLNNYQPGKKYFRSNFKNKIRFAMIGVLLLSLVIVGVGTVFYNISQFQKKHFENISEKIQSVLVELEHKLFLEEELTEEMKPYITTLLIKFSNVFYTDINLFDLDGNLYASSRPEVFELGLTGTRINPNVFREIYVNKSAKFIHNENIGKLSFVSAYVPFSNAYNEILAYLNLPYFTKQNELKKEIYTLVVAVANIYAFLILLTLMIALFITNKITEPLRLIQDKLRMISLGKYNEPLIYQADDEIGSLIRDYNRMVSELGHSAELLAKSERESAWREMAKQIAHEIKNPLTPMKLSLQHLQRAWDDKMENWDEIFKRTTNTLVEQIDNLSKISSEFSNFAQMPRANHEKVNIVQKVKDVISLFTPAEDAEITYDSKGLEDLYVFFDKEQLSRVFINLIKNALQSIPKNRNGLVHIELKRSKSRVYVRVSDNGKGIPPEQESRMFQPNFTTKTSGMGLGLAIVKNIVEHAGGQITYETTHNKGSSFEFDIPGYTETR